MQQIKIGMLAYLLVFALTGKVQAQSTLTLDECYDLARTNYPLIQQKSLITKSTEFTVANARTGYLPQLAIYGQATYQSEVTKIPIEVPGFPITALSKDQYKVYAEVNQTIYDGRAIKRQSVMQETSAQLEDQKVEVELYKIKERISQLFFGTLLINEQFDQIELIKKDIQTSLQRVEASIKNGVALKTNADVLKAELLKTEQREIELRAARQSYLEMLSLFINKPIDSNTNLQRPSVLVIDPETPISRPELTMYNYQRQLYQSQNQLSNTKLSPRVGLFVQGGYGRPALNFLDNDFSTYYLGGVRLSWNLSGFYTTNRDKQLLDINQQSVNTQQNTFLFNTSLLLKQQNNELTKLQELIEVDDKLIELRTSIKNTSKVQLDNGVVTANDYLRELNAEDQAKQNKLLHEIQLLMTQYNYQITSGN